MMDISLLCSPWRSKGSCLALMPAMQDESLHKDPTALDPALGVEWNG
jgi:hypothetical protein